MTDPIAKLTDLGERLARAYGWEDCRDRSKTYRLLGHHARWWDWTYNGKVYKTPDPEHSWQDFGELLEWAEAKRVYSGIGYDAVTLARIENRRDVIEAILEAVEHD